MVVVAGIIALVSYAGAVWLGVWLARRVQIAPPPGARGGIFIDRSFRVWVWSIRLFVFLIVILMVTWPVAIVLQALL